MRIRPSHRFLAATATSLCLLGGAGTAQAQAEDDGWTWVVAPYLWASDVHLDLAVNDQSLGGSAEFRDLLDKVDTAFMGHVEARRGGWGLFADVIYMDLSDSRSTPVGPGGPILGDLQTAASLNLKIYEVGGVFDLTGGSERTRVDLLAGIRAIDADIEADITLPGPAARVVPIRTGPSETDIMVGVRVINTFAERWTLGVRGDVSYGGTDGVLNTLATVGYTFGDTGLFTLTAGYRHMTINLAGSTQGGSPAETDIVLSGPIVGGVFRF